MFGLSSQLPISTTFPQTRGAVGPTTDTTQCCVYWYPRLVINEKPTSSTFSQFCFTSPTSSSLLLQTERVIVFCLSPLASHIDAAHIDARPQQSRYFSLTLFAPSLCLPCSISICFFVSCFCQFLRDFFWFFSLGELLI